MASEDEYYKERYQEVKDKVEYKDFLNDIKEIKEENGDSPFITEEQIVDMAIEKYAGRQNIQQTHTNQVQEISSLIEGNGNISIQGRLIAISNIKTFTTKKGREGKVANLTVEDNTGKIRVVMWTDNMKYMSRISEGDIVKINNLEVRKGYTGDLEVQMRNNSSIQVLPEEVDPSLPKYEEVITNLGDIKEDGEYNVIVRIKKISTLREIQKDDRTLQIVTLDVMDKTGAMEFTLWNKDTKLVETLDLKEHDTIKILKARAQTRYDQTSLSNSWNGRIIKGDYDVPEFQEEILKIGDAKEAEKVTIIGVITKIYDTITFDKNDGSEGQVRSIEVTDDTGSIRVTLWNKETEIAMDKGDIIKISGGNVEFDDYAGDSYRLNTGWNASIVINPEIDDELSKKLADINNFQITKIKNVLNIDEDEGREVDVIGRILSMQDIREFQRVDGTEGQVRSIDLADETGIVRTSLWDEKSDIDQGLGDAIKIENARTRLGQNVMELSVGRSSRITVPSEEEMADLPSYQDLERDRYNDRTISQLEENEQNTKLRVRITNVGEVSTFTRVDGRDGRVRPINVADETAEIQVSLWDDDTEKKFPEGLAIIIENPVINSQNGHLRLSIGNGSTIRQARQEEAELMPSLREIENKLYVEKAIEDIEEDDQHIKVKGVIEEINGDKILYAMCPNCNKRIVQSEEGYICDICGEKIEKPNYLMIISTTLRDETGTIQATFFRKQAEELIDTTTEEVIKIFEQTSDESSMSSRIEDLVGHEVTIIADSNFNEYDEDIRLNVRRLVIVL
ncbi:OB-fold nucleic acid binding domain-containing protein [Methanosphaera sp. Vir-13MRS]|uniref:OB-fold nucleic acid binding domain-containing protein n=1 Tax=Candidatus Methanosphaera massiliense TaxID=3017187 RepID=UPI0023804D8E|nr:OB-fold nucleic acid binding domain-containing protein [Candidatus Methanosphaera massiliense]MDE4077867.1 OB-fold nucleic acid binding domain-containing protein [Candidatus Methanosphaera massiliense]